MTGPFGWLVSRCEVVKRSYATYLGLDACMANLMRPGMYGSYHHITVPAKEGEAAGTGAGAASGVEGHAAAASGVQRAVANVVGTLCENNDWFAKDRSLPASAGVGDLFVIHDTGAHAHSMGFQYNGKLRAPELLIRPDGSVSVIRERETMESLYGNCRMPADLQAPIRAAGGLAGPHVTHGPSGVAAGAAPTYDATPAAPFPYGQEPRAQADAARGSCAAASPCETAPCRLDALRVPRLGACGWLSRERTACVVAAIAVGALAAASFAWGQSRSRR
jgi:diaminopimelate decarboxylase